MFKRPNKLYDPDRVTYSQCVDALYSCRRKLGMGVYLKVTMLVLAAMNDIPSTCSCEHLEYGQKK